ncbi:hypothetical protein CG386_12505, partial [Neisseria gonorrhoeae]
RHMQGLEAQSIYYFHRNGRPRPPCKPLKDKPPGLIRAAVGNHLPADEVSRQVDGRCLVSMLLLSVTAVTSSLAALASAR